MSWGSAAMLAHSSSKSSGAYFQVYSQILCRHHHHIVEGLKVSVPTLSNLTPAMKVLCRKVLCSYHLSQFCRCTTYKTQEISNALFSSPPNSKKLLQYLSHRTFAARAWSIKCRRKEKLIAQFGGKLRDERFKPN